MPLDWESCQVKKIRGQRLTLHEQLFAAFGYRSSQQRRRIARRLAVPAGRAFWVRVTERIARLSFSGQLDEFAVCLSMYCVLLFASLMRSIEPARPKYNDGAVTVKLCPPPLICHPHLRTRAE